MERNELYPIFIKPHNLQLLIVGGGEVALEKLSFLLKSSPGANVRLVATFFRVETQQLIDSYALPQKVKPYSADDLDGVQIVIAATDSMEVNKEIYTDARKRGILVNVADTPEFCDFYLGGVVTKGNVKIAISTNGKSPTLAKRLRQFFEKVIPEDINELAANLNQYRSRLKGDFETKVKAMNELTRGMVQEDFRH
jgi:precorrin-2 dehydrogenase / sirohydrochlorin ferrochelatase